MVTPAIVISILLLPLLTFWVVGGHEKAPLGGAIGIGLAFAFFGIGHFVQTEAMTQMLPSFVPFPTEMVLLTGILELAVALGLFLPKTRKMAGYAAIAVRIVFFPVNVFAAFNHTGMGGHAWGPIYLLIRAPLQALLIWWTWHFVVRSNKPDFSAILGPG